MTKQSKIIWYHCCIQFELYYLLQIDLFSFCSLKLNSCVFINIYPRYVIFFIGNRKFTYTEHAIISGCKCSAEEIKGRDLTRSYHKALIPTEMSNGQNDNIQMPPKSSITQQLRTNFGRSVGVTTAAQLVWLTGLRAQPSHSPQQTCNHKDSEEIIFENPN